MFAHREQRQLEQLAVLEVRREAAQRIGGGDDDRAVAPVLIIAKGDRLEPQHRRQQHLVTSGAQASGGGLVVGMRAGDENGHASRLRRQGFGINGRLHFATS